MKFSKHILKNGTRVVLAPMADTQTVTVQILVEAGSKYETKKNNGISHFLEHMMFKGTKKRPSAKTIAELLDGVGGSYNAFTGKEHTGYRIKVPKQHTQMALDVVSDMYFNSLLKSEEINREKGVILQERAMRMDTPLIYVADFFEQLLYGDQPAGWDIVGTEKNIKSFRKKDFRDYLDRIYLPKSTVVTVAGNFDSEEILTDIQKQFEKSSSRRRKISAKKVVEKQAKPKISIFEKKTDQTHIVLGLRGPNMFSPDRYCAIVLGAILGGGMSSRVFSNIRERHGLTYYIRAGAEMETDTGYLYMMAGVGHENLKKTVELMLKEFKKVADKRVSAKELKKAKEYLKGGVLMGLESSDSVASFLGEQELFRKRLSSPEKLFKKIDKISAVDLQKFSQKFLKNKGLNLAIIGPHKKSKDLQRALKV